MIYYIERRDRHFKQILNENMTRSGHMHKRSIFAINVDLLSFDVINVFMFLALGILEENSFLATCHVTMNQPANALVVSGNATAN